MRVISLLFALSLAACSGGGSDSSAGADGADGSDGSDGSDGTGGASGDTYDFVSAASGDPSVSYPGQVLRQVLIDDLKGHLGGMTARLDGGSFYPVPGDVTAELDFYYAFDSAAYGALEHGVTVGGAPLQTTYDEISTDKDLAGKIAGNDPVGQHVDWSRGFMGWSADGVTSPESLVRHWFATIDAQAVAWSGGEIPLGPTGEPVPAVTVTPDGLDLQQLLEKFLRGSVAYSQGADDYLDDDTEGKGLLSDHTALSEGKPYTELEHQWDEGFGYFGAARDYGDWTDDEIADLGSDDRDGDGLVDLLSEVNWGHSQNAAKRDRGAIAATDYTAQAWVGFFEGRRLLAETAGRALTPDELATLQGHRDHALDAWERAIASTVVHYINETLHDMGTIGSDDYDFGAHAKHWSELKGFALSLQFNRRSPLEASDFVLLHDRIGTRPVLPGASNTELADAAADLRAARGLLGAAYGFDAANLGDDDGANGW
jgi:hypothetical protein